MKLTLLATLALSALASALPPDYEYRPFAVPKPKINPHVDLRVLRDMCTSPFPFSSLLSLDVLCTFK